jgi:hypothetical protein
MLKIEFGDAQALVRGIKGEFKKNMYHSFLLLLLAVDELKIKENKRFIDSMLYV